MKDYSKKLHGQIDELVVKVIKQKIKITKNNNKNNNQIRSELSRNDRSKFNTVLIIDVHCRDIIDSFVRDR